MYNTNEPHASCIYSILNAADFRESFDFNLHGKLIDKKISVSSDGFAKKKRKGKNLSS